MQIKCLAQQHDILMSMRVEPSSKEEADLLPSWAWCIDVNEGWTIEQGRSWLLALMGILMSMRVEPSSKEEADFLLKVMTYWCQWGLNHRAKKNLTYCPHGHDVLMSMRVEPSSKEEADFLPSWAYWCQWGLNHRAKKKLTFCSRAWRIDVNEGWTIEQRWSWLLALMGILMSMRVEPSSKEEADFLLKGMTYWCQWGLNHRAKKKLTSCSRAWHIDVNEGWTIEQRRSWLLALMGILMSMRVEPSSKEEADFLLKGMTYWCQWGLNHRAKKKLTSCSRAWHIDVNEGWTIEQRRSWLLALMGILMSMRVEPSSKEEADFLLKGMTYWCQWGLNHRAKKKLTSCSRAWHIDVNEGWTIEQRRSWLLALMGILMSMRVEPSSKEEADFLLKGMTYWCQWGLNHWAKKKLTSCSRAWHIDVNEGWTIEQRGSLLLALMGILMSMRIEPSSKEEADFLPSWAYWCQWGLNHRAKKKLTSCSRAWHIDVNEGWTIEQRGSLLLALMGILMSMRVEPSSKEEADFLLKGMTYWCQWGLNHRAKKKLTSCSRAWRIDVNEGWTIEQRRSWLLAQGHDILMSMRVEPSSKEEAYFLPSWAYWCQWGLNHRVKKKLTSCSRAWHIDVNEGWTIEQRRSWLLAQGHDILMSMRVEPSSKEEAYFLPSWAYWCQWGLNHRARKKLTSCSRAWHIDVNEGWTIEQRGSLLLALMGILMSMRVEPSSKEEADFLPSWAYWCQWGLNHRAKKKLTSCSRAWHIDVNEGWTIEQRRSWLLALMGILMSMRVEPSSKEEADFLLKGMRYWCQWGLNHRAKKKLTSCSRAWHIDVNEGWTIEQRGSLLLALMGILMSMRVEPSSKEEADFLPSWAYWCQWGLNHRAKKKLTSCSRAWHIDVNEGWTIEQRGSLLLALMGILMSMRVEPSSKEEADFLLKGMTYWCQWWLNHRAKKKLTSCSRAWRIDVNEGWTIEQRRSWLLAQGHDILMSMRVEPSSKEEAYFLPSWAYWCQWGLNHRAKKKLTSCSRAWHIDVNEGWTIEQRRSWLLAQGHDILMSMRVEPSSKEEAYFLPSWAYWCQWGLNHRAKKKLTSCSRAWDIDVNEGWTIEQRRSWLLAQGHDILMSMRVEPSSKEEAYFLPSWAYWCQWGLNHRAKKKLTSCPHGHIDVNEGWTIEQRRSWLLAQGHDILMSMRVEPSSKEEAYFLLKGMTYWCQWGLNHRAKRKLTSCPHGHIDVNEGWTIEQRRSLLLAQGHDVLMSMRVEPSSKEEADFLLKGMTYWCQWGLNHRAKKKLTSCSRAWHIDVNEGWTIEQRGSWLLAQGHDVLMSMRVEPSSKEEADFLPSWAYWCQWGLNHRAKKKLTSCPHGHIDVNEGWTIEQRRSWLLALMGILMSMRVEPSSKEEADFLLKGMTYWCQWGLNHRAKKNLTYCPHGHDVLMSMRVEPSSKEEADFLPSWAYWCQWGLNHRAKKKLTSCSRAWRIDVNEGWTIEQRRSWLLALMGILMSMRVEPSSKEEADFLLKGMSYWCQWGLNHRAKKKLTSC